MPKGIGPFRSLALILLSGVLMTGACTLPEDSATRTPEAIPVHAYATADLFKAAEGETAAEVKAALSAGADPGVRDMARQTPLHWAAWT